ncbi:MAG: sensor histidine kinase [Gloeocapsa sp. DLM2.Bin57]|nr:MAG: sensor histidine kinase [Gloeocapsa sp. DLM2.Bin57]
MPHLTRNESNNLSEHHNQEHSKHKNPRMNKEYEKIVTHLVTGMIDDVNLNSLLHSLTIAIKEQLNLDDCLIFLSESAANQVKTAFRSSLESRESETIITQIRDLIKHYQELLASQQIVFLSTRQEIISLAKDFDNQTWQSVIIIPIVNYQCYWGEIVLAYPYPQNQWCKTELNSLRNLANHCLLAIQQHLLQVEKTKAETINQKIVGGLDYTFHECRQPLSAILGLARMLNEQIYGSLNPKQLEYIQAIISSGEHLLSLTNDFLDLSKIEAEKEELFPERILIEEICQASLAIIQPAATNKQLELVLDIAPEIGFCVADPMRLKQILVNLLSNGVKYTETGSITLSVTQDNQGFFFAVIDTGIGISQENQAKLFQPFVQIPNQHNRKQKGTGLGLVLSLKLARMHGGDLTLESVENQGSCFTLYLPKVRS